MSEFLTFPETQAELSVIRDGSPRTWSEIGRLLASVELHGLWRTNANSFTEWIRYFAQQFGKREGSYWRYLTAGRYYVELRKRLLNHDIQCPELQNLPDRISPENLELLAKLERVAPPDVIFGLAERVVAGVATRAELRDAWCVFRPVLAGRTARGHVEVPRYDPDNPMQRDSLLEAMVFRALAESAGRWLENNNCSIYHLFSDVELMKYKGSNKRYVLDALIITGSKVSGELVFHGIEVVGIISQQTQKKLHDFMQLCDFVWASVHEHLLEQTKPEIPNGVGILVANGPKIYIVRQAVKMDVQGCDLAKSLLIKMLK